MARSNAPTTSAAGPRWRADSASKDPLAATSSQAREDLGRMPEVGVGVDGEDARVPSPSRGGDGGVDEDLASVQSRVGPPGPGHRAPDRPRCRSRSPAAAARSAASTSRRGSRHVAQLRRTDHSSISSARARSTGPPSSPTSRSSGARARRAELDGELRRRQAAPPRCAGSLSSAARRSAVNATCTAPRRPARRRPPRGRRDGLVAPLTSAARCQTVGRDRRAAPRRAPRRRRRRRQPAGCWTADLHERVPETHRSHVELTIHAPRPAGALGGHRHLADDGGRREHLVEVVPLARRDHHSSTRVASGGSATRAPNACSSPSVSGSSAASPRGLPSRSS